MDELYDLTSLYSDVYKSASPMLVAVDNVIFGFDVDEEKLKILLMRRRVEPCSGEWSLIGSFVKPNESTSEAAIRVLKEFTGLTDVFLDQFKTYSDIGRDPGARVLSVGYFSLIRIEESNKQFGSDHNAQWFGLDEIPVLVADHNAIVNDGLLMLQQRSTTYPVGFKLLPTKFTLPNLLHLYQEIFQSRLDDRNFRKKVLASGLLEKLKLKDKSSSRKGAFLYRFDEESYNRQLKLGISTRLI